jgi:hypothetical protein
LFCLISTALVLCTADCAQSGDCPGRVAAWDFFGDSSVPPTKQQEFRNAFCAEVANVEDWAVKHNWPVPTGLPRLKIFVGEHYDLGRSLVPAWESNRGRMEFPADKVIRVQATIAHELTHFYFPNGNRMLAEGLAVYVQDEVGRNTAYTNFGIPVHKAIRCHVKPEDRAQIDLPSLDNIVTPLRLTINFGNPSPAVREQFAYIFASSFVRYLIDTYGMDQFRHFYAKTAFEAGRHIARTDDDWHAAYKSSLLELQGRWKSMIEGLSVDCTTLAPL